MLNRGPLVCVYCGTATTGNEALEHVVPESLGFEDTLYSGAVCTKCNHDLGASVDSKVFDELLMAFGQVASGTRGKRGRRDRIVARKGEVVRDHRGVGMTGGVSGRPHEFAISRFLAKIAVNVLTNEFGSMDVRLNHPDLIRFVRMPRNRREIWPFEARYVISGINCGFGRLLVPGQIPINTESVAAVIMRCASGVFALPLRRSDKASIEHARDFVEEFIDEGKKQGVDFGMMIGYRAENCDGIKPAETKGKK